MKIKHNFKREWRKISWQILDTIFEYVWHRNDCDDKYSKDWEFILCSCWWPELENRTLYVFWYHHLDNRIVSYTYKTEEEAKKVLERINEFTISS